jgi:hypothetical protein
MCVTCSGLNLGHPQQSCAGKHHSTITSTTITTITTTLKYIVPYNLQQNSKKKTLQNNATPH